MKYWVLSFLGIFFISSVVYSQPATVKGKVIDNETKEPLAFVNIVYNEYGNGIVTDIDGYFSLPAGKNISFLKLSYVGYESITISTDKALQKSPLIIKLKKKIYDIDEVIILPGVNPAHRIIKKVTENRKMNNPEKIRSFSYTSYNKMIITSVFESIQTIDTSSTIKNDTLQTTNNKISLVITPNTTHLEATDSALIKAKEFFDKQHLFLMESVSEREFIYPDKNNEKIIASRVSGFKDPSFTLLATQTQSFSFYDDLINILDKTFLNPISKGSTKKYLFLIEDTMYTETNDTLFVISYRPLKGKNFDGLKGILHINTNTYAIQNVIAEADEPKQIINIKIQQKYEFIENKQWFPVQLNTDFMFFPGMTDPISLVGIGKSYLSNIKLEPELNKKNFSNIEVKIEKDAHNKSEDFWNQYRVEPLTLKDTTTYHVIDSIGKEAKLDETLNVIEIIASGYIPFHFLNIDYTSIIDYNSYEGLRIGIGAITNDQVARWFSIGGHFAYGLKDNSIKYGVKVNLNPFEDSELKLKLAYNNDVLESGGYRFFEDQRFSSSENYRGFLIENMDIIEEKEVELSFRTLQHLKFNLFINQTKKTITTDYQFISNQNNSPVFLNQFNFTEAGINFKCAYKEKFMKTPRGNKISLGTKYPIIRGNITKGLHWLDGEFDYMKYEAKISKIFTTKTFGKTHIHIAGGYIDGDIPYSNLYTGYGSYKAFTFETANSFGTMRLNEFMSSCFISFFFKQDFGKLLFKTRKIQPEIAILNNVGFGTLEYKENHKNINIRTLEKGYYEAGFLINNLKKHWFIGYGLGIFYRYGPYSYNKTIDNFAFKFTITFNL